MKEIIRRNNKGFGLVEILIIVAILGIMAAIALPRFDVFRAERDMAQKTEFKRGSESPPPYFQHR